MWTDRLAPLLLALALGGLTGCKTCDGTEVFTEAESGRLRAVHEVGELGNPVIPPPSTQGLKRIDEAIALLRPFLSHKDPFTRLHAFESLRRLCQRALPSYRDKFPDLFDGLLEDADPAVRWRVAWALGRFEISRPGLRALALDPEERVAERAVWALGQARDEAALPELVRALDREGLVSKQAMRSLERITRRELRDADAWRKWAEEEKVELPASRPAGKSD